jgi:hypothetical protein
MRDEIWLGIGLFSLLDERMGLIETCFRFLIWNDEGFSRFHLGSKNLKVFALLERILLK